MIKKAIVFIMAAVVLLFITSCSIPVISDFIESDESLGKTNNTAVTIAEAMEEYLAAKKKSDLSLYGIEMVLNSNANGTVKLYYAKGTPDQIQYSDIQVAEVDSKTGHVERFSKADFEEDGSIPYEMVQECIAFDGGSLPIDSEKAVSIATRAFSNNLEFHYDYVQIQLSAPDSLEQYKIRFISMLNDSVYNCVVDAVSGAVLSSSVDVLE